MPGLRCGSSHPVTDEGIEHFAKKGVNGLELFSDPCRLMYGVKGDRDHGGFLTNPTVMMCRRCHRNARRLGGESHRRNIGIVRRAMARRQAFMPRL